MYIHEILMVCSAPPSCNSPSTMPSKGESGPPDSWGGCCRVWTWHGRSSITARKTMKPGSHMNQKRHLPILQPVRRRKILQPTTRRMKCRSWPTFSGGVDTWPRLGPACRSTTRGSCEGTVHPSYLHHSTPFYALTDWAVAGASGPSPYFF